MPSVAPQIRSLSTDELRNIAIDMTDALDDGEVLLGTPTIQSSTDFIASNEQLNSEVIEINQRDVAVGKAIQFAGECGIPGTYTIEAVCGTSAGQTIEARIRIEVQRSLY